MAKGPLLEVVRDWTARQRRVLDKTVEISLQSLYRGLTKDAPVLTGRFVFNFRLTEGTPANNSNLNYLPDRDAAMLYYQTEISLRRIQAGSVYFVTNTVAYAEWIEYNHPTARGYVRGYLALWDKIVSRAHRDALKEVFK